MPSIYFSGLASGLDTDTLIKQLMEIERTRVKRLEQRKADLRVDLGAWKDIGTRLANLRSALTALKLESTFTAKTATSSDDQVLTATATASAAEGTYNIGVVQLAQAHKVASTRPLVYGSVTQLFTDSFTDQAYTGTIATLNNLNEDTVGGVVSLASGTSGSITSNEIEVNMPQGGRLSLDVRQYERAGASYIYEYRTFDGSTWSAWTALGSYSGGSGTWVDRSLTADLSGPVTRIQVRATLNGNFSSSIIPYLADWTANVQPLETAAGPEVPLGLSGTFSITVSGTTREVTVVAEDSLEAIRDNINAVPPEGSTAGAGDIVSASIVDGRLVITSKTSGEQGQMSFYDPDGVLEHLGLVDAGDNIHPEAEIQAAQDAVFTVDGLEIRRSGNTISDVIPGVTVNLWNITDADGNGAITAGETITLKVAKNRQAAVDAIQAFVSQYNSTLDFIATKLGKTATGTPSDLYGDPTLARLEQQLRSLAVNVVGSSTLLGTNYTSLSMIGVTTGETVGAGTLTFDRTGKLTVNVGKLEEALEADSEGIYRLFAINEETLKGIAVRLSDYLDQATRGGTGTAPQIGDGIISSKQKMLNSAISDIDKQIERWEDRLARREEQLRRQFTAMESMLASLQSQGAWLAGQIAGLPVFNQKK